MLVLGVTAYKSLTSQAAQPPLASPASLPIAAPVPDSPATRSLLNQYAAIGMAKLATMYHARSNRATRSWRAANILAAFIQYTRASGSLAYAGDVAKTYQAHISSPRPFINRYYDDEGWWALTWIRAYDLTREPRYLTLAEHVFANLTKGWTRACGGGLLWSKFSPYKDAISNELFLQIAAELHVRVPGDTKYRRWALREWKWFRGSGMLTRSGLVVDGLGSSCKPDLHSTIWTYNQGSLIGGLLDLQRITHQHYLLATARKIADAVLRSPTLSPGGILTEPPCGPAPTCGHDAPSFKGIFMENLKRLYDRVGGRSYEEYLLRNAISMWAHDRRGAAFGLRWAGPFDSSDPARQLSAADLLITQVTGPGTPAAAAQPAGP